MTTLESSSSSNSTAIRSNLPLNQSDAVTSLLSLGLAAAGTAPIPIRSTSSSESTTSTTSFGSSSVQRTVEGTAGSLWTTVGSLSATGVLAGATPGSVDNRAISVGPPGSTTTIAGGGKLHRRLGSTGKTRRRLSDAREASARPILASPPTSSGLLSLSALSLSTSPGKPLAPRPPSTGLSGISIAALTGSAPIAIPISRGSIHNGATGNESTSLNDMDSEVGSVKSGSTPIPISASGKQKKRGVDYKCESCSKIYRHPNCLNKHRWEHTRQWREASKFVLSKHQQVQLLEAATILSFMSDSATSLPEDRSQWPTFLSGGSLPKAEPMESKEHKPSSSISSTSGLSSALANMPISTSVPARMSTLTSMGGPRMHDFTLPHSSSGVGVVERPGLVGVPNVHRHHHHTRSMSATSTAGLPSSPSASVGRTMGESSASGLSMTLPSSSIRSESSGSGSGSGSSGAEEEDADIEIDVEVMDTEGGEDDNEKGLRRLENAAPPMMKASKSYPVPVSALPLGYGPYGRSASYGTYGGTTATPGFGSYGANGAYASTGYQSAAAGYAHNPYGSYGSGSFGTRRMHGSGVLMKREDDEMSVEFSVKEEDEEVEEEEEEADDTMGLKKVDERRWNGMEMEVDMDMD